MNGGNIQQGAKQGFKPFSHQSLMGNSKQQQQSYQQSYSNKQEDSNYDSHMECISQQMQQTQQILWEQQIKQQMFLVGMNQLRPPFNPNIKYQHEIKSILNQLNEKLNYVEELIQDKQFLKNRVDDLESKITDLYEQSQEDREYKKKRRSSNLIDRTYQCPYPNCFKLYGSDVSLNLHIKLKHNGGSKTEREKLAREILQAQVNNEPTPEINIDFPPGFLENFQNSNQNNLSGSIVLNNNQNGVGSNSNQQTIRKQEEALSASTQSESFILNSKRQLIQEQEQQERDNFSNLKQLHAL